MAAKVRLLAALSAAILVAASVTPSHAQPLPTVEQVAADLQASCLSPPGGVLPTAEECLAAVARGIQTAQQYAMIPDVPPQVDIGFLLCQVMVERPALADDIVTMINQSGNANLAFGCSNAFSPDWTGPLPTIPTVEQVAADLQASCLFSPGGVLPTAEECLAAVARAILTAQQYAMIPDVPPQVDIGFLVCQVMVERPLLSDNIVTMINQSGNANLAFGCSNALSPDWTGPRPIISPA